VDFRKESIFLETGEGNRKRIGYEYRARLGFESLYISREKDERSDLVLFKFLAGSAIVEGDLEKGLVFIDLKPTTILKYPKDVVQFIRRNMVLDIQKDFVSRDILEKVRDFGKNREVLLCVDDYGEEGSKRERVEILKPAYVKIDLQAHEEKFDFVLWSLNEIKRVSENTEVIVKNVSAEEELERLLSFGIRFWQGKLEKILTLRG